MKKSHPNLSAKCESCGTIDDLDYFEYVLGGITLCDDCSWYPLSKIIQSKPASHWIERNGEMFPQDLT